MRRNILLGLVSLLLVVSAAFADTYYVSLSGDDGNDGKSEASAFRTIKKGVQVIQAGDTMIIQSGEYSKERAIVSNSGQKDAPIVIKAEVPGEVVMRGDPDDTGLLIHSKEHIVVEGIQFINYNYGIAIKYSPYITVRRCIFYNNHKMGLPPPKIF